MIRLLLILLLFQCQTARADEQVEPGDLSLRVVIEDLPYTPYEDEMVLLKIVGAYKIPISLETLEQPDLDGFDWMQLGHDDWVESSERGKRVVRFERIMALFPNRAGTIEIKPFKHRLQLVTMTGKRFERDILSKPVTLDVLPRPETADWWLPVRKISVEDRWSNAPEQLGPGEGALRIVTLDLRGVKPSLVPPMPELDVAGAMAFPHPEKRLEKLGNRGPQTLIFWRWTVRPDKPPSAYLKPLRLPYFDSATREHKEIVIASQRIAMTDEAIAEYERETGETVRANDTTMAETRQDGARIAAAVPIVLLSIGLLGGLATLMPGFRLMHRDELRALVRRLMPDPDRQSLKRTCGRGDAAGARAAAKRLLNRSTGTAAEQIAEAIAALDRAMFGTTPTKPDLKNFARQVLRTGRPDPS